MSEHTTLKGVNLGGWLLLERWMTPSLFAGSSAKDEYSFMQEEGSKKKIDIHRKTFIIEEDFKWLKAHGIEAVRIPVGYWVLQSDTPYVEAQKYLDWAMETARTYSIKVIIDLHGLKGSQNGRDHSGHIGHRNALKNRADFDVNIHVLTELAKRYSHFKNLWGIQIINEPTIGIFQLRLRSFYKSAFRAITPLLKETTFLIYSDGFTPRLLSGFFKRPTHPVAMDMHIYHMTTFLSQLRSLDWYFKKITSLPAFLQRLTRRQPIIIGEWSTTLRGSATKGLPIEKRRQLSKNYAALQLNSYSEAAAWFYWSYKTEGKGSWNFRSEVESGIIVL